MLQNHVGCPALTPSFFLAEIFASFSCAQLALLARKAVSPWRSAVSNSPPVEHGNFQHFLNWLLADFNRPHSMPDPIGTGLSSTDLIAAPNA
jgi:hypothetical protein